MATEQKKLTELGALWLKAPNGGGDKFLTGKITIDEVVTNLVIFKNKFKETDAQPDYRIYLSEPREQQAEAPAKPAAKAPVKKATPKPVPAEDPEPDEDTGLL